MSDTIYVFDRYRDGVLMAQGARIFQAISAEDARRKAAALFDNDPRETFVMRGAPPEENSHA